MNSNELGKYNDDGIESLVNIFWCCEYKKIKFDLNNR